MMIFRCPECQQERTGLRRRCYVCSRPILSAQSREKIRHTLTGVRHSDERRRKNSEGAKRRTSRFDIASLTRGKPSPHAKPVGSTHVGNGHIQIKCPDGKWRYRARVVWEEAHGPIPHGYLIHHLNEDPFDDRLENLQLVTRSEHASIHSTPERMRAAQLLGVVARKRNGSYR